MQDGRWVLRLLCGNGHAGRLCALLQMAAGGWVRLALLVCKTAAALMLPACRARLPRLLPHTSMPVDDLTARAVVLSHHGASMMRELMWGHLTMHCTKL